MPDVSIHGTPSGTGWPATNIDRTDTVSIPVVPSNIFHLEHRLFRLRMLLILLMVIVVDQVTWQRDSPLDKASSL
jgi:hypothetical protein